MKTKNVIKLIKVLNKVYIDNEGKTDAANLALKEMKNLIETIPDLMKKEK